MFLYIQMYSILYSLSLRKMKIYVINFDVLNFDILYIMSSHLAKWKSTKWEKWEKYKK